MKNTLRCAMLCLAFSLPAAALAKEEKAMMSPMRSDTNGDGVIDKAEWIKESEARFARVDADHDGKITRDEMHVRRKAMRQEMQNRRAERMKQKAEAGKPEGKEPKP